MSQRIAKISPPSCAGLHVRERLFRQLDEAVSCSAVWVCGPAGAGKSSLVATYLTARHRSTIWYRVDAGDRDAASFFHYLQTACQLALSETDSVQDLPVFSSQDRGAHEAFARRYFRRLFTSLRRGIDLVFDDLHNADTVNTTGVASLNALLRIAVEEAPSDCRVFMLSRSSPDSGCARLLANRNMQVIGWDDLRFLPHETATLARQVRRNLSDQELELLRVRTSGWAAGVTLLLQANSNAMTAAPECGDHGALFSYFAAEVFGRAEPAAQNFMLLTAWMPWVPERIANRIAADGTSLLANLRGQHYFTDRLDAGSPDGSGAYRYHDLFREFLRSWATRHLALDQLCAMQLSAADYCREAGMVEPAMDLYLGAKGWSQARALLAEHAPQLLVQGRHATLQAWLGALPDAEIDACSWLVQYRGECLQANDPDTARRCFEQAFHGFRKQGDLAGALRAWCAVSDLSISPISGLERLHDYVEWLEGLIAELPDAIDPALMVRTANNMRKALQLCRPGHPEAARWAELADAHLPRIASVDVRVQVAEARMAEHVFWSGDFAKAQTVYHALAGIDPDAALSAQTRIRLSLARHCFHWSNADMVAGLAAVEEGISVAEEEGIISHTGLQWGLAFRYCMLLGEMARAKKCLGHMAAALDDGTVEDRMRHHVCAAWLALADGSAGAAHGHALAALELAGAATAHCAQTLALLGLAHTSFAIGKQADSVNIVNQALATTRQAQSPWWEFNCLITKALMSVAETGESPPTRAVLEDVQAAFEMGSERGFVHFNFMRPDLLARLCAVALRHGIEPQYARRLIRICQLRPPASMRGLEQWPWRIMVYSLRPFVVLRDGVPVTFVAKAQAKPLALLKALLACGGERVSEARLTQLLWPDAEGDRAHWVFRVTLRRLRALLDCDQSVEVSNGQVTLNPALVWTDLDGFSRTREALDELTTRHGSDNDETVSVLLTRLFDIYRAPFLNQESALEEVFLPAREKLRSHFRRCVRDAARYWERRGDWDAAADCCIRGIEIDPLAEELHADLMQAHLERGDTTAAWRTFQDCANVLQALGGLLPGRRMQELKALLDGEYGAGLGTRSNGPSDRNKPRRATRRETVVHPSG